MPNISIVTAFFDIGRGDWTQDKNFPHYIQRSREVYLERFARLLKLKNDITVLTSKDIAPEIEKIAKEYNKEINIITYLNPIEHFKSYLQRIDGIQDSIDFQSKININQKLNPEYRVPEYVLVTNLKAFYVKYAIREANTKIKNDMVAWIDFGYCRSDANIPDNFEWNYDFDPNKIHFFNYKMDFTKPIEEVIYDNDVYILGAKVVARKDIWGKLARYMVDSIVELAEKNIVDDDQGHFLNVYRKHSDKCELHLIPDHQLGYDPFVLFNQYNNK